jgi:hypothetical protein
VELFARRIVEARRVRRMATWQHLGKYILAEESLAAFQIREKSIGVRCPLPDGGSQLVLVQGRDMGQGVEWATLDSVIGNVGEVDLLRLLREVGDMDCGGITLAGDSIMVRHSVPLQDLDMNEFLRPLFIVANAGDRLSRLLGGG